MEKVIPILEKIVKYGATVAIIVAAARFLLENFSGQTPVVAQPLKVTDAADSK